jgi:hypothetical protein
MPFPPYDIPLGQVSEFCIYHIVTGVDPLALFPIQQKVIPGSNKYTGVADVKDIVPPTTKPSAQNGGSPPLSPMTFQPPAPQGHCYLGEVASVLRTKNAGPYELTLDVMFDNEEMFHKVKQTGLLSKDTIARLYNIPTEDILVCMFWDPALAFKSTIKRQLVSGQFGETDLHGSQQHAPAMYLMLPFSRQ